MKRLALIGLVLWAAVTELGAAACSPVSAQLIISPDDVADVWINGNFVGTASHVGGCANPPPSLTVNPAWLSTFGSNMIAVRLKNTNPTDLFVSWVLDITCAIGHTYVSSDSVADITYIGTLSNCAPTQPAGSGGNGNFWDPAWVPSGWGPPIITAVNTAACIINPATGTNATRLSYSSAASSSNSCDYLWYRQDFILYDVSPTITPTFTVTKTPYPPGCGVPVYEGGASLAVGQAGNNFATVTRTYTVPSVPNTLLLVTVLSNNNLSGISSITYAGIPMALQRTDISPLGGINTSIRTYILPSPPPGNNVVQVNFSPNSNNEQWYLQADVYSGVDQAVPIGAGNSTSHSSTNNFTTSLTTTGPASVIRDFIASNQGNTMTTGPSQFNTTLTGATSGIAAFSDNKSVGGPGAYNMSYTWSSTQGFYTQLLEIRGAASCGGTPTYTVATTPSNTPTFTRTATPSVVVTPTYTRSSTPSATPSLVVSPTFTRTPSPSFTPSLVLTATPTLTQTSSFTPGPPPTSTLTQTMTRTPGAPTATPGPTPQQFKIVSIYPNPASEEGANFVVSLPFAATLTFRVFNLRGELIWEGIQDYGMPGSYSYLWKACNNSGAPVSYGAYYLTARADAGRRQASDSRWLSIIK